MCGNAYDSVLIPVTKSAYITALKIMYVYIKKFLKEGNFKIIKAQGMTLDILPVV